MFRDSKILTICKASAGSGKTFRLALDYISLLFASPDRFSHRFILAVTFTNKATEEMKSRIVKELYQLSIAPENSAYTEVLSNRFFLKPAQISERAKEILSDLLSDYSSFHISTIDRFFLQVIRSFIREFSLQSNYNVELDTDSVLRSAVEKMFYGLDQDENADLLQWLKRYSEERVDDSFAWNPEKDILSLAKELFKESYKSKTFQINGIYEKMNNKELLRNYKAKLDKIQSDFEVEMQLIARKALSLLEKYHLTKTDFLYKESSFVNQFFKIKNQTADCYVLGSRFSEAFNHVEKWYAKTAAVEIKNRIEELYSNGLNDLVALVIENCSGSKITIYNTAILVKKEIYILGILSDIEQYIKDVSENENLLLLSDTNQFLSKIIAHTDTPFIYEKTGIGLRHFMIDEFQDTSALQWSNFLPLIHNSLSSGYQNLIVGDVKQSIYRWRSSDWDLLNSKIYADFNGEFLCNATLDVNWRSAKHIVDFNNSFFAQSVPKIKKNFLDSAENAVGCSRHFAEELASKIETAYENVTQKTSPNPKKGYVEVSFLSSMEDDDWEMNAMNLLLEKIEDLRERNYSMKDLAILVRTNKEAVLVAEFLLTHSVEVISNEALLVGKAETVQFLVALLTAFVKPFDSSNLTFLLLNYFVLVQQISPTEAFHKMVDLKLEEWEALLFADKELLFSMRKGSLFEQVEEFIRFFGLSEKRANESAFLQAFQDVIFSFESSKSADISNFLIYWDEKKEKCSLSVPEGQNAIRILTVHKSKGLEFNVLLIPFCDWKLNNFSSDTRIWCTPSVEPFNEFPILPVKYSRKLEDTVFSKEFFEEKMHQFVDVVNVAYVAFTRACNELFIFAPPTASLSKKEIDSIPALLYDAFTNQSVAVNSPFLPLANGWNCENQRFHLGEKIFLPKKIEQESRCSLPEFNYLPQPFGNWFNLYLKGEKNWSVSEVTPRIMQINYGVLMHDLLSRVVLRSDLERALDGFISDGQIVLSEKTEILNKINDFIESNQIAEWFLGKYRVLNEVEILQANGMLLRPDRVMLDGKHAIVADYKFGRAKPKEHYEQVLSYRKALLEMGYSVESYLCYLESGEMMRVD